MIEAVDGSEAMGQIEEAGSSIDLVLTDVRMPRMGGVELVRALSESHPRMPVLFISGYPFDLAHDSGMHPDRICAFVAKPFKPKQLVETVRRCLGLGEKASHA